MMLRNLCGVMPFDSMCIINIGRGGRGAWDMYSFKRSRTPRGYLVTVFDSLGRGRSIRGSSSKRFVWKIIIIPLEVYLSSRGYATRL